MHLAYVFNNKRCRVLSLIRKKNNTKLYFPSSLRDYKTILNTRSRILKVCNATAHLYGDTLARDTSSYTVEALTFFVSPLLKIFYCALIILRIGITRDLKRVRSCKRPNGTFTKKSRKRIRNFKNNINANLPKLKFTE